MYLTELYVPSRIIKELEEKIVVLFGTDGKNMIEKYWIF